MGDLYCCCLRATCAVVLANHQDRNSLVVACQLAEERNTAGTHRSPLQRLRSDTVAGACRHRKLAPVLFNLLPDRAIADRR